MSVSMSVEAFDLEPGTLFLYQNDTYEVLDYDVDNDQLIVQRRNARHSETFNPYAYVRVIH